MRTKITNDKPKVVQIVYYSEITLTINVENIQFNIVIGYNSKNDKNQFEYFRLSNQTYNSEEDLSDAVREYLLEKLGDYLLEEDIINTEITMQIDDVAQVIDNKIIDAIEEFEIEID